MHGKIALILIYGSIILIIQGCCTFSGSIYNGPVSDHFDGKKFYNQELSDDKSFWDFLWWQVTRTKGEWNTWSEVKAAPKPQLRAGMGEMLVTYVNHSTVLLQYDSINVLTDPIWADKMIPIPGIGPERRRPPGIKFEDLPPIDIVLISHNHYDHMDIPTLEKLDSKFHPVIIVPLGNKEFLEENGFHRVIELDWWNDTLVAGQKITAVPARHFSNRGLCDRNTTLWCGFVLGTTGGPLFFGGDTGFGKHFRQIFDKFGSMRFSMIPIGAFKPRWFMSSIHLSPDEAVDAHILLDSKLTMGIHYGTFAQADDGEFDPIIELKKAMINKHVSPDRFIPLYPGIQISVSKLK